MNMEQASKDFMYAYLNASSPSGGENEGQQVWLDYVKGYTDGQMTDVYGTAVGVINPSGKYKVVLEAHADEIAWMVSYITEEGYIYVIRNGGSDHQIAPSMRVNLHTENGKVKGVFGWPAIHVRDEDKEESPSMKNIFIDVGAESNIEVRAMGIHVGTLVTFEDGLMELGKNYLTGRALDNRMGGYMIAQVAKRIKENNVELPFCLYLVNSVQEEIGLRGAEMIAKRLKPDVVICTDVTHDTQSPMYENEMKENGDIACGDGPVLSYGASIHPLLVKMIGDTANRFNINFQRQAAGECTGTDTDSFAYSLEGIPSALVALPLKYMHTTVETVHKDDIEKVIDLLYYTIINMNPDMSFRHPFNLGNGYNYTWSSGNTPNLSGDKKD